jgi:large repetitive protein
MNHGKCIIRSIIFLPGLLMLLAIMSCSQQSYVAPILVLATENEFGTYTGELLKAEGFNEFRMDSLTSQKVNASYLKQFDLVILADSKVSQAAKEMFFEFVKKGGNLIAFRPDPAIAELFGITPAGGNVADGYITIDASSDIGRSLTSRPVHFHGTADIYNVTKGTPIATIISGKRGTDISPAVVSNNYGKGHCVAFLYNLPKNIVLTRQGNPLFAGIEKDGIPGLRGMDLFTDGWLDNNNSTINQADEQMVLLSHCIEWMSAYTKPLPRLWYFPDTLKCLVTLTNDGEYKSETDFEPQFQDVDSMGAKMSIYIIGVDKVSREWVDKWTAKGFEIAGHPDDTKEAGNPDWNNMDSVIKAKKSEIAGKYGLQIRTNVNHWFVWCGKDEDGKPDFAAQARLEELNGIELDINYAHYDLKSNQTDHFLGPMGTSQGNFTGSGLVMKFANVDGKVINVYQQMNAVYDQEYNESHDPDGFFNSFKGLMDRSLNNEVYSFISVKSHNDEYYFSKTPLMKMLAYANSNGIPVWTALKLLDFIKMREEASFTNTIWSNNKLSFHLNSSLQHSNYLTVMVPNDFGNKKIKGITKNGNKASFIVREIKGSAYALLTVKPGENYSIVVNYGE